MSKLAKYFLIAFSALIALLLVTAGIIAAMFDPNDYKPLIIKLVQEKKQRTLTIPGDIKLTFFPKIGADLGKVSLSEHNGSAEFASINNAKVSLELLPLLSKQVVVDRVAIDGITADIKRFKDGSTNFDDLLSKNDESGQQIKFDIDNVSVTNAKILFDDQQSNRKLAIANLNLETGKIANGVAGGKVSGDATLTEGARTIHATFSVPSFEGSPQAFKLSSFALDVALKDAQLDATARISGALSGDFDQMLFMSPQLRVALDGKQGGRPIKGSLTTPVTANMKTQAIDLPAIALAFTLPNPGGGLLNLKAEGKGGVDIGKHTLSTTLKGSLDGSAFDARFGLAKFAPLTYTFDIAIDRIDADRYQSKSVVAASPAAAETPIDLSVLKDLHAAGSVKIGALKVKNIKASNVRFNLHAAGGKADVNSLAANLYGGTLAGALSATASNPPRLEVRQNLQDINLGALLRDAISKEPVDGKGNLQLDVRMQGATVTQMKKGLNGAARLVLRDGAVRGINIAQSMREAKAAIGAIKGGEAPRTGTGSSNEKTDFSELSGSFRIANGVAHNDDLNVKSPLLRLAGSGDIDLAQERLDYLVKATVVSTLQGQGGPELQALKGVTVPVRLSGPLTSIGWKIDFAGMAKDLAKQKIEEKKEEVKARLQEQLSDKLKGLFGK